MIRLTEGRRVAHKIASDLGLFDAVLSPTRATIHTGQNPLHHGILRPPMYGEAGGLDGAITMPLLLKNQGYVTQGVGKWHMGENQVSAAECRL